MFTKKSFSWKIFAVADVVLLVMLVIFFSQKIDALYGKNPLSRDVTIEAQNIYASCKNQNKENCYEEKFTSLIEKKDFPYAEKTLYALMDTDEFVKSCHVIAHRMGRAALLKEPGNWQSLAQTINVSNCGSGFLHGVLEAYVNKNPTLQIDGNLNNGICNQGRDEYRKRMCSHFMGHVFLVDESANLEKSLPKCGETTESLRFDCFDGLFMEYHQKLALAEHQISSLPEYTPAYLKELQTNCQKYTGIEARACWTEIAEIAAKVYNYNPQNILRECQAAQQEELINTCYSKGNVVVTTYPLEQSQQTLTSVCSPFITNENKFKQCVSESISSLMFYSAKFTNRAVKICSGFPTYENWCFNNLGDQLKGIVENEQERKDLCKDAPPQYQPICAKQV